MITSIVTRMPGISHLKGWGRNIIASSPDVNLFLTKLLGSLFLVQASKSAIVSLIKSPSFLVWNPQAVHLSCDVVISTKSACKYRSMRNIEYKAFLFKQFSSCNCFIHSLLGQRNIVPTCKLIFQIPNTLPMPDKDNFVQIFGTFDELLHLNI